VALAAERPENENLRAELPPRMVTFGRTSAPAPSAKRVAVNEEHERGDVDMMPDRLGSAAFPQPAAPDEAFSGFLLSWRFRKRRHRPRLDHAHSFRRLSAHWTSDRRALRAILVAGELKYFFAAGAVVLGDFRLAIFHPTHLYGPLCFGQLANDLSESLRLRVALLADGFQLGEQFLPKRAHVSHPVGSKNMPSSVW
jgi:hypothetical protein